MLFAIANVVARTIYCVAAKVTHSRTNRYHVSVLTLQFFVHFVSQCHCEVRYMKSDSVLDVTHFRHLPTSKNAAGQLLHSETIVESEMAKKLLFTAIL